MARHKFNLDEQILDSYTFLVHGGRGSGKTHLVGDMLKYEQQYGQVRLINVKGEDGALSHRGRDRFAIDWALPVGTRVLAARAGTVVGLYQGSADGGPDISFKGGENFVWIGHDDGTLGWYAHFKQAGVLVRPGA